MDTLAVQLTVPLAGPVRDFNPLENAPCQAHQGKRRPKKGAARETDAEIKP